MGKAKTIITITAVFILLFSIGITSGNICYSGGSDSDQTNPKSVQTKTTTQTGSKAVQQKSKSTRTGSKSTPTKSNSVPKSSKPEPENKIKDYGTVRIGTQSWAVVNLNVGTFRNGDSIPEARTNKEWVTAGEAGKPAWCYYNNNPANGLKYGKLYNWYAVNDPRGLAPVGWILPGDADWAKLIYFLEGPDITGRKIKSTSGWSDDNNGTNETGFTGLPGGYRIENGTFMNFGSIGTWWSTTESKAATAIDHYLSQRGSLLRSSSPRQRGEAVRCLRK